MASEIKVDTISEKTSAGGVTIDGLLIKDGNISGDVALAGTTPTFTIGDAGAEDATLLFDGNAQDFHIGLDDTADDLVIGVGSTLGTTTAMAIDENTNTTFSGKLTVGVDDTGKDVKFFGASAGAYMEWDESADELRIMGASADATTSTGKLLLATSLTDINANDVIGKIDFQAPHEAGGTDAITVAASIRAIAQSTFSSSSNATDLIFYTGHSEAAAEKIRFTSQNEIGIAGANYGTDGQVLTSAGAGAAVAWEDAGGVSTIGGLTDVSMDITAFPNGFLLQTNSDGSAPSTGTLSDAQGNIGIGNDVFAALTSGDHNVAIGYDALKANTSGHRQICIGLNAGIGLVQYDDNIAIGADTMGTSDTGSTGVNVAIGKNALGVQQGSYSNVCIGKDAGHVMTSGHSNVLIGKDAGGTTGPTIGYKSIGIGHNSTFGTNAQYQIQIGEGLSETGNNTFNFGKASNVVTNDFTSDANWSQSSDERIKRNIQDDTLGLDFINDLRTVTYQWKDSTTVPQELYKVYNAENQKDLEVIMHGMLAQEVKTALDTAGVTSFEQVEQPDGTFIDGKAISTFSGWHEQEDGTQSVSREMFVIPLIKAVKELSAKIDALTARVTTLEG